MASLLNTGLSALNTFQLQLSTTGHNIANVNTEGYSRQRAELSTLPAQGTGSGFIGSGVKVDTITRAYDDFIVNRFRDITSTSSEATIYNDRASILDNLLGDTDAGMSGAMQNFFNAMQDVADDPTSLPAREALLSEANILVSRFQGLDGIMTDMRTQVNNDLDTFVSEVNTIAQSIANVNDEILNAKGSFNQQDPNDLLDQRDLLIEQLSELVSVDVLEQDNGAINVFIGNGQPLVLGPTVNQLDVQVDPSIADQRNIVLVDSTGTQVNITRQISGGKLGGLLNFSSEVLDPAQNALGRLAIGMASLINDEHLTGMDLNGQLGTTLFDVASPQLLTNLATPSMTASLVDPTQLTGTDYRMRYTDPNTVNVTRVDTGVTTSLSFDALNIPGGNPTGVNIVNGVLLTETDLAAPAAGTSLTIDPGASPATGSVGNVGYSILDTTQSAFTLTYDGSNWQVTSSGVTNTLEFDAVDATTTGVAYLDGVLLTNDGTATAGDSYTLRPTRAGAAEIGVNIGDPRQIAVADPVVTVTGGPTTTLNSGTAVIGQGSLLSRTGNTPLGPAGITLTYDQANAWFEVSLDGGATTYTTLAYDPATDSGNTLVLPIIDLGDFGFTMNGTPADGDQFQLLDNTDAVNGNLSPGVGDNRNALLMAGLHKQQLLLNGSSTFGETYGELISDVGLRTRESADTRAVQERLLDQASAQKEQVSGVNLDEEASNLIRQQQAYQAAAQLITVANTIFDTLISATAR